MVRAANERSTVFYLGCILWVAACIALIRADLGAIAIVATILAAIGVFGLREKWDGEVSAYSVFNKDGKSIAGGTTAQQLDRQLRAGGGTLLGGTGGREEEEEDASVPQALSSGSSTRKIPAMDAAEKERRRRAAAAAAERRFQNASKHD